MMARPSRALSGDEVSARPEDGFLPRPARALARRFFRASDLLYGPWTIGPGSSPRLRPAAVRGGDLRHSPPALRTGRPLRDAVRSFVPSTSEGGGRSALPGLHDRARRDDRRNIAGVGDRSCPGGRGALFWSGATAFFANRSSSRRRCSACTSGSSRRNASLRGHALLREGLGLRRLAGSIRAHRRDRRLTTTPFNPAELDRRVFDSQFPRADPRDRGGGRRSHLAGDRRRGEVDRARGGEAVAAKVILYLAGGLLVILVHATASPRRWLSSSARPSRSARRRERGGAGDDDGDALRPRPRDVRERGGVRNGRVRLRDGAQPEGRSGRAWPR